MSNLFYHLYDFIFGLFYEVYLSIYSDFSLTGEPPIFTNTETEIGSVNLFISLITYFIIFLIIGLFIYFIYRLIMFIVRRFLNV